jgi:hypothetical protein
MRSLSVLAFPVIFLLCCGSLALCVTSFMAKERWRWLSIAGAALAFVPALFY